MKQNPLQASGKKYIKNKAGKVRGGGGEEVYVCKAVTVIEGR